MDLGFEHSEGITIPEGCSYNDEGQLINADGKLVDENGNIIEDIDQETEEEKAARLAREEEERKAKEEQEKNGNDKEITLVEGQSYEIEVDGKVGTYTVDKDLNLVDKDGNIFKTAEEAKEFIKGFTTETDDDDFGIEAIQKALGIEIVDENGKPVEFENTSKGVVDYVNSVIENQKEEIITTAINGVFAKYPILEDVLNYYVANGNSLEGFNETPDRSNITIDDSNVEQQESIIRTAWKEQNRTGNVDSYINYLKTSGTLLEVAKSELEGLQKADKDAKDKLATEAKRIEDARNEEYKKYWTSVHDTIKGRKIGGYTIPESITVNRDGKKYNVTPDDFFNYLYQIDKNGHSRYENDLLTKKPEAKRDDDILQAYLMFTGGSYADLVKMAINESKVQTIRLQAKNNAHRTTRTTPKTNPTKVVDLGY